jgi:flagellar FliL protein
LGFKIPQNPGAENDQGEAGVAGLLKGEIIMAKDEKKDTSKKEEPPKKEDPKAKEPLEKEEKDEEKQEEAVKKGFPLKLIVIVVLVVVLAGGGFVVYKKMSAPKDKGQIVAIKEKETGTPEMGTIYPMESFIVNLIEPSGKRYLKIQIQLELENENLKSEIDKRMPQFKDAIISLLSNKSIADINNAEGKMQLRAELAALFNQYLKSGKITNVFFTDFIIQ